MKIVSLLPSATEIVCQLGLRTSLVGTSHECDYPVAVQHLPRLTRSDINPNRNSLDIHHSVEALLKNAVSVYDLNLDLLKTLRPDFVITQDLCDVCAVSFIQVEEACKKYCATDTKIISLRPTKFSDIWADMSSVADALNVRQALKEFKNDVDRRIRFIKEKIQSSGTELKSVLTIEWIDPVFIGGMWVPEMIEIAGGSYLLASPGERALTADREQLKGINPDVVIVKPCGFKLEQTIQELETLKSCAPWESWNALQNNQIYLVDGNAYFNRPGPRIIDSLEILAHCVHPTLFPEFKTRYEGDFFQLNPGFKGP